LPEPPFTLGFAAETEALEANARNKLHAKSLDMIAANRVGPGLGFEVDDNALQVFWEGGEQQLGRTRKTRLARQLVALLAERYQARDNKDKVIKLHAKDSA
jgi:phosphopantothenoylcysteine decarboxylase/phosphopantothenate--cysteine ligase